MPLGMAQQHDDVVVVGEDRAEEMAVVADHVPGGGGRRVGLAAGARERHDGGAGGGGEAQPLAERVRGQREAFAAGRGCRASYREARSRSPRRGARRQLAKAAHGAADREVQRFAADEAPLVFLEGLLLVLLELVAAVAVAVGAAVDAAVFDAIAALQAPAVAERVEVQAAGDEFVVDEPRDFGADFPELHVDVAFGLPQAAVRFVPEAEAAADAHERVFAKGQLQFDLELRIDVAVGVDVRGERRDRVVFQRELALAAEEAEFFAFGFAVLEGQRELQLGGDARPDRAAERERFHADRAAELVEEHARIQRDAGRWGDEYQRRRVEFAFLEREFAFERRFAERSSRRTRLP
jgi:hypothetical protein